LKKYKLTLTVVLRSGRKPRKSANHKIKREKSEELK